MLWPSPQIVSLPLFLVRLGLPPVAIAKGFRTQLDGLKYLTQLDCAGMGYLPSPSLVNLRVSHFQPQDQRRPSSFDL